MKETAKKTQRTQQKRVTESQTDKRREREKGKTGNEGHGQTERFWTLRQKRVGE